MRVIGLPPPDTDPEKLRAFRTGSCFKNKGLEQDLFSGLFILLGLIPFVGPIILIVLFAQKGQPEANQYGPPATGAPTPGIQHA